MASETNPVNWFEIPTSDIERARAFYEHVLGVQLALHDLGQLKMAWFPMQQNAPGAAGSLVQAESYQPSHQGSLVYFSVEDIGAALARVEQKGGKVLGGKKSIGEYGFVAHFEDSEGNRVALHSTRGGERLSRTHTGGSGLRVHPPPGENARFPAAPEKDRLRAESFRRHSSCTLRPSSWLPCSRLR